MPRLKQDPYSILPLTQNIPYRTHPVQPTSSQDLHPPSPPQLLCTTGHQGLNLQHLWLQTGNKTKRPPTSLQFGVTSSWQRHCLCPHPRMPTLCWGPDAES